MSRIGTVVALLLASTVHAADNGDGALEEVTVTAQKRTQNIQDVPMSISALDGAALDAIGAKNFEDFAREIPGLAFANLGPGQNRFTIRGVSTFSGTSVVGIYLDDSPIASTINYSQPSLALYDVERVEVLKGPQGTLYGEGSLGGTLRYITADPDPTKFAAKSEATVSNTEKGGTNYDIEAAVNLPLIDNELAVRLVALHQYDSGYIDNIPLHDNNFNDVTTDAFRAKVLWKATDALSIQLT
ncbi:MAG TPA: TonB-dependent receptor, partial [Steroidobacteraceae bacterium]